MKRPATEGPATKGRATEGRAVEGPATEGPGTEGPATEGPATEGHAAESLVEASASPILRRAGFPPLTVAQVEPLTSDPAAVTFAVLAWPAANVTAPARARSSRIVRRPRVLSTIHRQADAARKALFYAKHR